MPTYDYVCDACGHSFEHRQSMSSNKLRTCPACKKRKLRRLIGSGAGVIFKGSGFYETDYKRAGKSEGGKKKQTSESSSSDGETKADSKPPKDGATKPAPSSDKTSEKTSGKDD